MNQKYLMTARVWHVLLFIIVLLLAGCQSAPAAVDEVVEPVQATEDMVEPTAVPAKPTSEPTQAPEPADTMITTPNEMSGIWLGTVAGETGYVMYTPDGQFTVALIEDDLTTAPRVTGEYWFENDQIHLRDLQNAGHWTACDQSIVGVYAVTMAENKEVTFQTVDDACNEGGFTRQYLFANMVQERVGDSLPIEPLSATQTEEPVDAAYAELTQALQAVLDDYAVDDTGAVLMIDAPDMGFTWKGVAGMADPENGLEMLPDDQFIISSGTKMYTAVTILKLAEQGLLNLDDPISMYLPAELVAQLLVLDGESYGETITVRQLLSHTSGLEDFSNGVDANNNEMSDFKELVLAEPDTIWTPEAVLAWAVENAVPVALPGESYHYSDTNYQLLSLIVENVTGKTLAQTFREMIFDPVGMEQTYFEFGEPVVAGVDGRSLTHAFYAGTDWSQIDSRSYEYGSGGIVSTVEDQTRFLQAWANDELFDDPASKAAMTQWGQTDDAGVYYGLGVIRFVFDEWGIPDLGEVQGHGGLFNSYAFYWPDQNVTIVGTLNSNEPGFGFIGLQIDALSAVQAHVGE